MSTGQTDAPGVLLVGDGQSAGWSAHLRALASSSVVRLFGVVHQDEKVLDEVRQEYGCWISTDLAEGLRREEVIIVDVCSPTPSCADQIVAAARHGKHVVCEMPIAGSMHDAAAVHEAVTLAGVRLMTIQPMRFRPRWRSLHREVQSGAIGRPVFAHIWACDPLVDYERESAAACRSATVATTQALNHYLDTMSWLIGCPPAQVFAATVKVGPESGRMVAEEYWSVQVCFMCGATGHLALTVSARQRVLCSDGNGAMVIGTEGTICSTPDAANPIRVRNDQFGRSQAEGISVQTDAIRQQIEHFAQCIATGRTPEIELNWSLRILEACLAAMESAGRGRSIELQWPVAVPGLQE